MIDINTGSESFYGYAFNVGGFVGKIDGPSVEAVIDGTTIWSDIVKVDVYVSNSTVDGLWVATYALDDNGFDLVDSNPQVEVTA